MELSPASRQTPFGRTPPEWGLKQLGELYEFSNGVNADKRAYGYGMRFVNVLEPITFSHLYGPEIPGRVSLPDSIAASYAVRQGDLLFNRTSETDSEVGLACVYLGEEPIVFGGFVIRGRPIESSLDFTYAGYALRAPGIRAQIIPLGQGAVRANIGQEQLRGVVVPIPPRAEQQAIAAALSDIDALLDSLTRLIAKKRDLKQAAMQQLLTGRTRLPRFKGSWSVSSVGNEFDVQLGKMLDSEKNAGIPKPYLGNSAVQWGSIDASDLPLMRMSPRDIERFRLRRGDLLVCEGGVVGRSGIWQAPVDECYYQKALHRLRPKAGFNVHFMAALLELWSRRGDFKSYVTQTSIAHLPRDRFIEMPLPVPCEEEQREIATVLSDMDAELAALEARRAKTQALKQAMMQALLTGRIRLVSPEPAHA